MAQFTDEEVKRLRELLDIDAIRKTRNLYTHYIDTARVEDLANLFTDDGICEFGPYGRWEGRETIYKNFYEIEKDNIFFAMHSTTNHWVELTSDDTAVGRAYLIDIVTDRAPEEIPIVWFAVYDEDYRKIDGQWLISRCSLQFTWPKRHLSNGFPGPFPPKA